MADQAWTANFLMIHPIFIFILIITSNFLAELFPCKIQKLLKGNVFIKHVFGFLTLLFFAVLVDPSKQADFNKTLMSSALLYIIFLVMVNSNILFFMVSLFILGILYILNLKKVEINNVLAEKDDVENSAEIKTVQNIDTANIGLLVGFALSSVLGFFVYMGEKKIEYKKDFNYFTFIFGKAECNQRSTDVKWTTALKTAFSK